MWLPGPVNTYARLIRKTLSFNNLAYSVQDLPTNILAMRGNREKSEISSLAMALFKTVIIFIAVTCVIVNATDMAEELQITRSQKVAIDKLRQRVLPYITDSYMKEDLSMLRWLRATKFNIDLAEKRIKENIKWRKQNRLDSILKEDFSDMEADYPYVFTIDKQGQPRYAFLASNCVFKAFIGFAGEWDVRGATVTGRGSRVIRYINRALEQGVQMVRDLQYHGQNVTRINLIIDMDGFNLVQHACVNCLFTVSNFVFMYDNNYPGQVDRVLFINTPPTVATSAELIRTNANPETMKAVKFYGKDKNVWQRKLLEFIDKDKLPQQLGGTMDVSQQ